jgi:hypothetical protein
MGLGNRLCTKLNLKYALTDAHYMLYSLHTNKGDNEMISQYDNFHGDEPEQEAEQRAYEERMWEMRSEEE